MAATNPRQYSQQVLHYIRKTVNWNDTGIGSGVKIGTLPSGAMVTRTDVYIPTAFNASSSNSLSLGTSGTTTELLAVATVVASATGYKNGQPNASPFLGAIASDQDVYALYAQTGTAATAGQAVFTIQYSVNNDG